jgi:hypothetical protein
MNGIQWELTIRLKLQLYLKGTYPACTIAYQCTLKLILYTVHDFIPSRRVENKQS